MRKQTPASPCLPKYISLPVKSQTEKTARTAWAVFWFPLLRNILPQKDYASWLHEISGVETAEVHAAGCIPPGTIPTIPQYRMPACFHLPNHQSPDFLTEQIIDTQPDLLGFRELNPDGHKCVEGVGKIL